MRCSIQGRAARLAAPAVLLALAACDDLTSVDAPGVIPPDDYTTPAGATVLAAGAITRFHESFGSVGVRNIVVLSGLMADELAATASADPITGPWDRREALDPSPVVEPYPNLHDTRQRLLTAIRTFQQGAPDSTARIGQLFALLGYTSVFFGENYCAGIPLSARDADFQPVHGQPLTTAQLFDSALVAFDSALVYGADSARISGLARVGRGRALLNQGRFAEAAQAVADVSTEYSYEVTYVLTRMHNGLATDLDRNTLPQRAVTVPDREGGNGIPWRTAVGDTAPDPRAAVINRSPAVLGADNVTPVWQFARYQGPDSPIRLADGIEARLIQAEVALHAGDAATWLAIHNALRAGVAGLDPLVDPAASDARIDLHFRERAFWLFLTGHRLGDLRRLVRQYGRDPESVFPTGHWRDGVTYGPATNMAPPAAQADNPNYTGCLARDA